MAIDPYFVLSLVSIGGGVIVLAFKVCFASKCDTVELGWGAITIHRAVEREERQIDATIGNEHKI